MPYLKGSYLRFTPKMRSGMTCINLEFQVKLFCESSGRQKKTKACFNFELILGKQISSDSL